MAITILSSNAMAGVLRVVGPRFERASGAELVIRYATTATLALEIASGASVDVALLTAAGIERLMKLGRIVGGSSAVIGRSGVGIAVRAGAARPDITTPEALTRVLREAPSVAYTTEGASGLHFVSVLRRLGLEAAVTAKARTRPGGLIAELVARGEAALAVQQIGELLAVPGVDYVGPLPPPLQEYTVFAAGIGTASQDQAAARGLIAALAAPDAAPVIAALGMEPAGRWDP
ncbi:MAG TPA: substrate-binding domain-containing protein [Stellaceae bacterium]|nr:substrate-binding domain-containing protein [Stellaceae bacterium]